MAVLSTRTDPVAWLLALTRAALPGTVTVRFRYEAPSPSEIRYSLKCLTEKGVEIGDPRDYDILKSIMSPLEKLCACEVPPLTVELNLNENSLSFENHG